MRGWGRNHLFSQVLSFLLVLAGFNCTQGSGAVPHRKATPRIQATSAIVLVIDGPRQSEMWDDPEHIRIPHLATELAPQGTLMRNFRNNGPTYTAAGHTALCTGFYQDIENGKGSQLPDHPSMFQYFLKAKALPQNQALVITSKDKLALLANTNDTAWNGQFMPATWCGVGGKGFGAGYADDADTMAVVKTILGKDHPRLVIINLKEPDASGHGGSWMSYLQAIRASDARAAELWAFLQSDPGYKDHTALFITHDHGRHLDGVADGFVNHGDDCEGCRRLALVALGPDFKKGAQVSSTGEQIDVPVTIAWMLGFQMPGTKGRVLKELFK